MSIMVALAAVRAIYVRSTGIDTGEGVSVLAVAIVAAMLALSWFTMRDRLGRATLALRAGAALALAQPAFASFCIVVFASGRRFPLQDATFEAMDRALGFDWLAYAHFLDSHEWLWQASHYAYVSIGVQFILVLVAMTIAGQAKRLYAYLLAQTLSLTCVGLVALVLPSLGAYAQARGGDAHFLHLFNMADTMTSTIEWLRSGHVTPEGITSRTLVSFPSYHACSAVLFAWSTWRIALLRWPMLGLNVSMVASTPVHGSHYLVDLVAGVAVAAAMIAISMPFVVRLGKVRAAGATGNTETGTPS